MNLAKPWLILLVAGMLPAVLPAAVRFEAFDREPATWDGVNNRNRHFEPRTVVQDFGWSAKTRNAGGQAGEVGGRLNPAGEAAYYAYRLPAALTLEEPMVAEGRLYVARGAGHSLLGFFNASTVKEWRTANTLVARLNGRGETYHCHVEYCTSRWRAEAGVIGEIVRGERITPVELPAGNAVEWKMVYDPAGAGGRGLLTFTLGGRTARCEVLAEHRREGLTVTHFGLMPIPKTWDSPGEVWIDDVKVNGVAFDFENDPKWEGVNNRRRYETTDTRPKFDFGWSPTHYAGGGKAGELGGLVFRGDCREPARMACYGDRLEALSLKGPLEARGKVAVRRAISDSGAAIGFYHSRHSMQSNPSQKQSIPMDFIGINIEGPSSEGFFFYPMYRTHSDEGAALGHRGAPKIYPDGKVHDWFLRYDPDGADGRGRITVGLGDQACTLDLAPGHKEIGATFDRFGICTAWIDGNSVTVYYDDLSYTCAP